MKQLLFRAEPSGVEAATQWKKATRPGFQSRGITIGLCTGIESRASPPPAAALQPPFRSE